MQEANHEKSVNPNTGCCKNKNNGQNQCASGQKVEEPATKFGASSSQDLDACQAQLNECKDKLLRVQADFENFSRRTEKERSQWMRSAQAVILKDLLTVMDDLDRALDQAHKQANPDVKSWISGFDLIAKSLRKVLNTHGVQEITQVQSFDPNLHEALMHVEVADKSSGSIIDVLQKGYTFKGEVLRPAQVSVAK